MSKRSPRYDAVSALENIGFKFQDAVALRRISMTLHRWHEMECGTDNGCIERDEKWAIERAAWPASDRVRWWDGAKWVVKSERRTYDDYAKESATIPGDGAWRETDCKPFLTYDIGNNGRRARVAIGDREAGALKRLAAIMARYPSLASYVQGDPRGAALYILRPGDVPEGADAGAFYSRGVVVCK